MNVRVATYHRVSTTDQNPEGAQAELRKQVALRGFQLVTEIEETGSGTRNDREGLLNLLKLVQKREIDVVLVWKLDRFGRSALDVLNNINLLQKAGVRFVCTSQGIDISPEGDPMSRLLLTMMAAFAEFERNTISERSRMGISRAKAKGIHCGRPRGDSRPSPETVRELRKKGLSWRQIAAQLGCSHSAAYRAVSDNLDQVMGQE